MGENGEEFQMSPWTPNSFKKKHNKNLTGSQAKIAAEVANEILRRTGDEGQAVRAGNVAAKNANKQAKKKK